MDKVVTFLTKEVREGEIDLRFGWINKSTLGGLFEHESETYIVFNAALMIVDTFLHELYHYHMPNLTEEQVIEKTNRLIRRLTASQIKELFVFVMSNSDGGVK